MPWTLGSGSFNIFATKTYIEKPCIGRTPYKYTQPIPKDFAGKLHFLCTTVYFWKTWFNFIFSNILSFRKCILFALFDEIKISIFFYKINSERCANFKQASNKMAAVASFLFPCVLIIITTKHFLHYIMNMNCIICTMSYNIVNDALWVHLHKRSTQKTKTAEK